LQLWVVVVLGVVSDASYVRASCFFYISGVCRNISALGRGWFVKDNICHALVTGQSMTKIILKMRGFCKSGAQKSDKGNERIYRRISPAG
jgi:hypothetical protein